MFDQVWLKDKKVIAVKPVPELEPFFKLNYEDFCSQQNMEDRSSSRVEITSSIFSAGLYPVTV
jgi:hypothetical protein